MGSARLGFELRVEWEAGPPALRNALRLQALPPPANRTGALGLTATPPEVVHRRDQHLTGRHCRGLAGIMKSVRPSSPPSMQA